MAQQWTAWERASRRKVARCMLRYQYTMPKGWAHAFEGCTFRDVGPYKCVLWRGIVIAHLQEVV